VWVSLLSRAQETTALTARVTGLTPHVRLRELDFGQGEERTVSEMEQSFLKAMAAFHTDPVAYHLPGGEDPRTAAARAVACFSDIALTSPGGRVLVVMHSTLIRLSLCQLLGLPLAKYRSVFPFVRNGALTEFRFDEARASYWLSTRKGSNMELCIHLLSLQRGSVSR
jgi:broad specificity phosphatase PhoE